MILSAISALAFFFLSCSQNPLLDSTSWNKSSLVLGNDDLEATTISDFIENETLDITFVESVVPDDGLSDQEGFEEALTIASDMGLALSLPAGTYEFDSTVEFPPGTVLKGEGDGLTIIKGLGDGQHVLVNFPDAENLIFEDLVFDNILMAFSTGSMEFYGPMKVENISFNRCLFFTTDDSPAGNTLIFARDAENLVVQNSVFLANEPNGQGMKPLYLNSGLNVTIKNNVFGMDLSDDEDLELVESMTGDDLNTVLKKVRTLRASGDIGGSMSNFSELIRLWNKGGLLDDEKLFTDNICIGDPAVTVNEGYIRDQIGFVTRDNYIRDFNSYTTKGTTTGLIDENNTRITTP